VKSDGLGPLLMPDIGSYQAQRIDYDIENLPIGYDLGEGGFSINPLHSSSYNFIIGSDANITAMGYFYDSDEKPIPLTEGTVTHQQDSEFPPVEFFTNSKGRFAITGLKSGSYKVKLYSVTPIEFLMKIPENEGNIIRLGDIRAGK
jgi:outer membrane usher protein